MQEHLYELDITSQVQTSSNFGPPTLLLHLLAGLCKQNKTFLTSMRILLVKSGA